MPSAPLPPTVVDFIQPPRPAVVGTVRPDGAPATTATWYDLEGARILLNMAAGSPRARNLRNDPRISLTILGESWYDHVSLLGRVVEFRDDPELVDLDRLSRRYTNRRYPKRYLKCVSALMEVEQWHAWGKPAAAADAG